MQRSIASLERSGVAPQAGPTTSTKQLRPREILGSCSWASCGALALMRRPPATARSSTVGSDSSDGTFDHSTSAGPKKGSELAPNLVIWQGVFNTVTRAARWCGIKDLLGMNNKLVLTRVHLPNNCASVAAHCQITSFTPCHIVNIPADVKPRLGWCWP
jgi:hypothetical protein